MSAPVPYDVFISYRRESGSSIARLLREALEKRGYRVFLDVEDLKEGHFDEALLREVERIPSFLVVLSPGCLDRCAYEGDWLRVEIAHAIRTQRKIIPVTLPGFVFPEVEYLAEELRALPRHQAVEHTHRYFDASMDQLCRYLGKPTSPNKGAHGTMRHRWGALVGAVLLIALVAALYYEWSIHTGIVPLPSDSVTATGKTKTISAPDLAFLGSLSSDMCAQLVQVNGALADVQRIKRQAMPLFDSTAPSVEDLKNLGDLCGVYLRQLDKVVAPPMWKGDRTADLDRLGIPSAEVHAYYTACLAPFRESLRDFYTITVKRAEFRMTPEAAHGPESRLTELRVESIECDAKLMYYGLLGLLNYFPAEGRGEYQKLRAQWTNFPDREILSKADSDALTEKMLLRIQEIASEMAELGGNLDVQVRGLSQQFEKEKAALVQKCRFQPDDNLMIMWQKILALRSGGLVPESQKAMEQMVKAVGPNEPGVDTCVKTAEAFWATPEKYDGAGVMVMLFENGRPHSVLKRGDIILSINGAKIGSLADFKKAPKAPDGKDSTFDILRLQSDGTFAALHAYRAKSDPRIAPVELLTSAALVPDADTKDARKIK